MSTTHKKEAKAPKKGAPKATKIKKGPIRGVKSIEGFVKGSGRPASFVKVDTDVKGDVKMTIPRDVGSSREMTRGMLGSRPYATIIPSALALTSSSANTALAILYNIDPTATFRWSSWAALFDEARVMHARMVGKVDVVTAGTTATNVGNAWAAAFDPDNPDAAASVLDMLTATKHIGPIGFTTSVISTANVGQATTLAVSRDGYHHLSTGPLVKTAAPTNSSGTASATGPVQGAWFATDTTAAIAGYWKVYADAIGTNGIVAFSGYQWLTVEFRMRG